VCVRERERSFAESVFVRGVLLHSVCMGERERARERARER